MPTTTSLPTRLSQMDGTSSQQRLALDNLIRRELKVGDPGDPRQIAQALLERYQSDRRAQAIAQESRGLPFLQTGPLTTQAPQVSAAAGSEWQQALGDIESDLRGLTSDAILKDVTPELQGWAQSIRSTLGEGYDAARFALDPRNRDKGFAMRRQLNDFARLARLVGVHTPSMVMPYRKLAQSLDEAANLLLVIMGEALASVGFGGSRYMPQVAYSELQVRRDAVVYALRNLVGSTQVAYGQEEWPRGLDAYRQVHALLDAHGQSDLRSLLVETELARTMDELVQRSGDATSDGLRAVGATSLITLSRLRRFLALTVHGVKPESPPFTAFLEALQLFVSAFESNGGFRLMKIARPPILLYGLYGNTSMDDADTRLIKLITHRNRLAELIDCMAGRAEAIQQMVLLDKVLYDADRAIDLYALGSANFGPAERRAAAFAFVIDEVLASFEKWEGDDPVKKSLDGLRAELVPEISLDQDTEMRAAVLDLAAQILNKPDKFAQDAVDWAESIVLPGAGKACKIDVMSTHALALAQVLAQDDAVDDDAMPPCFEYLELLGSELCTQYRMECRWDNLVHSMVPGCASIGTSLATLRRVVQDAFAEVAVGAGCDGLGISVPATSATVDHSLVEWRDLRGNLLPPLSTKLNRLLVRAAGQTRAGGKP